MVAVLDIHWVAGIQTRSKRYGLGFLSLLISPVISLFALLLMQDLAAKAIRQAREESRFRDQLAVLSDIKAKMQTMDAASIPQPKDISVKVAALNVVSQASETSATMRTPVAHQEERQNVAALESPSISTNPVPTKAMDTDPYLLAIQSAAAKTGTSDSTIVKRMAFYPMAIAVGFLIISVAILVAYVFYLQKTMNKSQEIVSVTKNLPLVSYRVEAFFDTKINYDMKRLIVNADGNLLVGPSDAHMTIEVQNDFNGDGIVDAIIKTDCGGNACLDEFQFISVAEGKLVIAPVEISHGFNILEENGRFIVDSENRDEIVYWGFDGRKAFKVRSIKKERPLTTIESTSLCLQNRQSSECPDFFFVLQDDKKFKSDFYLMLNTSKISENDKKSLFDRFLDGGFFKINDKKGDYLFSELYSSATGINIRLLINLNKNKDKVNFLTGLYEDNLHVEGWMNSPSDTEKEILLNFDPRKKASEPNIVKPENNITSPVEPKRNVWFTPESGFTTCIEARTGPADRIEESKGKNPTVVERNGGRIVQVTADYDQGRTVSWIFYRDKANCELVETNVEKKLADKYR